MSIIVLVQPKDYSCVPNPYSTLVPSIQGVHTREVTKVNYTQSGIRPASAPCTLEEAAKKKGDWLKSNLQKQDYNISADGKQWGTIWGGHRGTISSWRCSLSEWDNLVRLVSNGGASLLSCSCCLNVNL